MKTEIVPLSKIKRYENNPRKNLQAVPAVKASLDKFGWRQPIVVDQNYVIIVGDTRYLAALERRKEGKDKAGVPVHVATDMTPAQVTAYRLADNRVGEISEWDDERLFKEFALLAESQEDFDLVAMGFSEEEVSAVIKPIKKEDLRYLEDFDVLPTPKPQWILISAPADECAAIISKVNTLKLKHTKLEYTGDKP